MGSGMCGAGQAGVRDCVTWLCRGTWRKSLRSRRRPRAWTSRRRRRPWSRYPFLVEEVQIVVETIRMNSSMQRRRLQRPDLLRPSVTRLSPRPRRNLFAGEVLDKEAKAVALASPA